MGSETYFVKNLLRLSNLSSVIFFRVGRMSFITKRAVVKLLNVRSFACAARRNQFAVMPSITVSPSSSLIDEPVSTVVSGLAPSSPISIRSTLEDRVRAKRFEAVAHFVADEDGRVNLNKQESQSGSFEGLEPMGLFWSLCPAPGQRKGTRFTQQDVTTPAEFTFSVYDGHLEGEPLCASTPLACTKIEKGFMTEKVERIKVHSGRLRGTLFKPKGPGPFAGVIDMFGTAGGIIEYRAALLASRGFAALALPFFAYEDLPKDFNYLEFEYFEEAAAWLPSQPFVRPGGIGVLGLSFGGSLALEMAARLPQVKAVVALACMPYFLIPITYGGKTVPTFHEPDMSKGYLNDQGFVMKDIVPPVSKIPDGGLISIEKSNAHFLFLSGEDDMNVPAAEGARRAIEKLRFHGKDNYESVSYPETGHLLEPPYLPIGRDIYNVPLGLVFDFGGEMKAQAHACQDAWARTLSFLRKHLVPSGDGLPAGYSGAASSISEL